MVRLLLSRQDNDQTPPDEQHEDHHGLSGWAIFIIVVVVFLVLAGAGWLFWLYLQRRRGGRSSSRNYPSPAPGGVVGWFNDKIRNFKNRRIAAGSYEQTGSFGGVGGGRGRRGAPLDPDEAWDTRVGNEADVYGPGGYYEEQELGLQPPGQYSGTGYGASAPGFGATVERGSSRSRQRELDERYDEETGRSRTTNPFGDDNAAPSLRGVSPRPIDTHAHGRLGEPGHSEHSPTERRSMFRENV